MLVSVQAGGRRLGLVGRRGASASTWLKKGWFSSTLEWLEHSFCQSTTVLPDDDVRRWIFHPTRFKNVVNSTPPRSFRTNVGFRTAIFSLTNLMELFSASTSKQRGWLGKPASLQMCKIQIQSPKPKSTNESGRMWGEAAGVRGTWWELCIVFVWRESGLPDGGVHRRR